MTRRDFIMVTRILQLTRPRMDGLRWPLWERIRNLFAEEFENTNPNFDRERFEVETMRRPR